MRTTLPSALLAAALSLCLSGCLAVHSALQAGAGQFTLITSARPLDEAKVSPSTPPAVRALLEEVDPILRYADAQGLKRTQNYQRYVALHRSAPVWVVSACPELSLTPKTWSFPIAGRFPYLAWFSPRAARDFADSLALEGLDVDVRPARAYSTLGWFDDPLLSSMLTSGPSASGELADDLLHESTHATLHISGQTPFNEGLATFAGTRLARGYLIATYGTEGRATKAFEEDEQRRKETSQLLSDAAKALDTLYRSPASDDDKRKQKKSILTQLQNQLGWRRAITNATLSQHRTYQTGEALFDKLLKACASDFKCFFARLGTLSEGSFQKPQQEDLEPVLAPLMAVQSAMRD
ncbi:MAG: aminopeptidase [Deltaproteobacteria bacterium]|nr:aminopeptidase [Deltaproteobacteria bacterium]